ncbi:hypothetical protein D3C86_1819450 [compost metagenome]
MVGQAGQFAEVGEEVADSAAYDARGDEAVAVDQRQVDPLVEALVEVVDTAVPLLPGIVVDQRHQGGALELALVELGVELQALQRLGEAIGVGGLLGQGADAGGEQGGQQQAAEGISHGRTPEWPGC